MALRSTYMILLVVMEQVWSNTSMSQSTPSGTTYYRRTWAIGMHFSKGTMWKWELNMLCNPKAIPEWSPLQGWFSLALQQPHTDSRLVIDLEDRHKAVTAEMLSDKAIQTETRCIWQVEFHPV